MTPEEEKELAALRELAAGRCAVQAVIDALGPLSLWSKDAFDREIAKAVAAEREACADLCKYVYTEVLDDREGIAKLCEGYIRGRQSA